MKNIFFIALTILFVISITDIHAQVQWVNTHNGTGNGDDIGTFITYDATGNVYVIGSSVGSGTGRDYTAIKYNSIGVRQWTFTYNPASFFDQPLGFAVDASGNIYMTGISQLASGMDDYATIKLNSSGVAEWIQRYNGPANNSDRANDLKVDASGNVYVTGGSPATGFRSEFTTIKYSAFGLPLWIQRYSNPLSISDVAQAMTLDNSGNVYVTGISYTNESNQDYMTIKYNSSGVLQWVQRYNGTGNSSDDAWSIAIDGSGNVYITGTSQGTGPNDASDIATIKYNSSGVEQWVQRYNGPGNTYDNAYSVILDDSGYVYVSGNSTGNGTNLDYIIIKYNSSGIEQWIQRYNGSANAFDRSNYAILDSGNLYITGTSHETPNTIAITTVKYNTSGVTQWIHKYSGTANFGKEGHALAVDNSENVYVTGHRYDPISLFDFITFKFSSPPLAPSNLIAQAVSTSRINLNWTDNSINETGFKIEISTNAGTNWILKDSVPQNVMSYADSGLTSATTYHYRIYSYNTSGISLYSNTAFATTQYLCQLSVNAGSDTTIWNLSGDHANLTASVTGGTAPFHYSWSTGDTTQSISVSPADTTSYYVNVTDASSCSASDTVKVNVFKVACGNNGVLICQRGRTRCIKLNQLQNALDHGATLGPCGSGAGPFTLFGNYPNPFNPVTSFKFSIPVSIHVKLVIYDILGREVNKIVDENMEPGTYSFDWNADNFASGIYFYSLKAGDFQETRKMVLMK